MLFTLFKSFLSHFMDFDQNKSLLHLKHRGNRILSEVTGKYFCQNVKDLAKNASPTPRFLKSTRICLSLCIRLTSISSIFKSLKIANFYNQKNNHKNLFRTFIIFAFSLSCKFSKELRTSLQFAIFAIDSNFDDFFHARFHLFT